MLLPTTRRLFRHVRQAHPSPDCNVDNYQFKDEYEIQSTGEHTRNNRVALNFTTRLSITYNWSRYFINANGQFNNFNYKHNAMHGHLNDWYINASVGVRL